VSSDLDVRIATAFGDGARSEDLNALIVETEAAAVAASEAAAQAHQLAHDPALSARDVTAARREMDDAAFRRERLQTAVTRLIERLREVEGLEENQRRQIIYDKAKAERDRLAAELKANYPGIESQLGRLITKIEANDREIEFVNAHGLPTGAERLKSAELIARGVESWRVNSPLILR